MNNQRIAIICDSGCDCPKEFIEQHDIRVVPLTLNYKSGSYQSGIDITTEEVIDKFAEEIPTTSLPSPKTIQDVFEKAKEDGYTSAVFVGISGNLSATNQTASLVAGMVSDFPILVIDTKNIGIGAALNVIAATQMVEEGIPFDELEDKLTDLVSRTCIYFVCESLDYLHKGGRISDAAYKIGSTLNIKPIITCSPEGRYITTKKSRGMAKAMRYEVSMTRSRMENYEHVVVATCCTSKLDVFDEIEKDLNKKMDNIDSIVRSDISAALVVHTGPKLVGIAAQPNWHYL